MIGENRLIGGTPDLSMTYLATLQNPRVLKISYPLTLHGASSNSGGGMTATGSHKAELKDVKFLDKEIIDNWPNDIPKYWSAYTISAASIEYIANKLGKKIAINKSVLAASIVANEMDMVFHVFEMFKNFQISKMITMAVSILYRLPEKLAGKFKRRFFGKKILSEMYVEPRNVVKTYISILGLK